MTQKGRVSPFGDPRIKGCSPLPAAFRSVPRPSSPLSAKASTKCPYALDPKLFRRTQRADPPCTGFQASTCNTQHSFYYPPGRQPQVPLAPSFRPRPGNPCQQPVAFLSTMSKSRYQGSGIRYQSKLLIPDICDLASDLGAVAQLGEHLLCKQGVTGSIPVGSTRRLTGRSTADEVIPREARVEVRS